MGLDIVELVMAVEERFDIELPDDEVAGIATVGELHAFVCRKLGVTASVDQSLPVCNSQVTFHRLRRQFTEAFGVPRRAVAPSVPTDRLLSPHPEERRAQWDALRGTLAAPLPELESGRGWMTAIWAAVLAPLAWGAGLSLTGDKSVLPLLLFALAPVGGVAVWRGAQRNRFLVPAACGTVGQTVRAVMSYGPDWPGVDATFGDGGSAWARDAVWDVLVRVVASVLDVPPDRVTPAAHFVDDFGAA